MLKIPILLIIKSQNTQKKFKNEWLYIRGISKKCGEFMKKLNETDSFEDVFASSRAKALIRHFKDVLEAQKMGKLQNISQLKFKLSAVDEIIDLRIYIYTKIGIVFYSDYLFDDDFQDFFENFIIFTNNVNIKNEDDFENDFYIEEFKGRCLRIDSDIDSDSEIDIIRDFLGIESESESESD